MNDTFLNSANAPYVAELYSKFRNDPESVDTTWKDFFNNLNEDDYSVLKDFGGPEWKERPSSICLLYTSPSPRDSNLSRMPSSA